ncbi:RNA polymerase sigma factor [Pedobacter sp. MC2016-24]|uniref:RNA polymerase sigma factor n=1 Tax=Pedobacter sp. MC2016-24 TaxID=2780090 RepID=UPI0018802ACA|nr:RNA polymerase sigma-70 factor [Pedobacter sp. MC2016-24]MBE9600029.1 RNA polymerase sigma-70 factor [Pedobacter sp. MC2016-24]
MTYKQISDAALSNLVKGGDYMAFTEIYNRNWLGLLQYVSKIVTDLSDAEDIVQEVFISFWKRHKEIELRNFSSWLYAAARKQALFYLRTSNTREKYLKSLAAFLTEVSDSLNEELDAKELQVFIDREIEKLPLKMREVFILSRKEHLSHKEIAERLEISDKTVKKQIGNVLKHFRGKMDDESIGIIAVLTIALFRK